MTDESVEGKSKKKFTAPHTFVLLFAMTIIAAIFTYIIPAGEYEREMLDGREVIVDGTYETISSNNPGFLDIFNSVFQGMNDGAGIIFYLLMVGGTFGVLRKTKAIEAIISSNIDKLEGKEIYLIPVLMGFFALAAGTYGMIEDSIPYILILLPLLLRLRFDSMIAVAIPLIGTAIGYTGSFLNPFNVGVAQTIAELPLFSGIVVRIICWLLFVSVSAGYVMWYARKIQKDPKKSFMYHEDKQRDLDFGEDSKVSMNLGHILILLTFAIVLVVIVIGVSSLGWYLKEMSGLFLLMGIIVGIIGKMSINEISESFAQGCKDLLEGALAVGLAFSIVAIIQESNVMDTIIYGLSNSVQNLSSVVGAVGMFGIQSVMNFIVPSGSGQAALTMPIMTPLSDIIGINRQTAVLAFQFGDGISNAFTPTAGWLLAGLSIAGISWIKWARFMLPLLGMLYALGAVIIVVVHLFVWPL